MIIYVDILIFLNFIVNYFLLLCTAKLLRKKVKTIRIILAAFAGGISSFYIFLPQTSLSLELIIKILICFLLTGISFGLSNKKQFLKASGILFLVTCGYAGSMIAVWNIFKPKGMAINNSIVYINISPTVLVLSTAIAYIVFYFAYKIFARNAIYAKECDLSITVGKSKTEFKAIIDTGNSLEDVFGKAEIIIADKNIVKILFPQDNEGTQRRYRAIPFNSVSGYDLLDGYRCDSGIVTTDNKTVVLEKPILASSKTPINEGYCAIVNPKILD